MKHMRLIHSEKTAEVSLNPMIDMVFILLVFFIVATVFVDERGFTVQRPGLPEPTVENPSEPLSFTIDRNQQIHLRDRIIDLHAVQSNTSLFHQQNPEQSITVETHAQVSANRLLQTCDAIRQAGVTDIVLLEAH